MVPADHGDMIVPHRPTWQYVHFAVLSTQLPFIGANCVERSAVWTEGQWYWQNTFKSGLL